MYEPIVDTTGRVGEVLLQSCDSTSKGPRKNNDNIIKIKTGPNLGKLAVWTRTINRQDQLVIETLSFQLFHCSNLFSSWTSYLLLTKNCHRWWLQCGGFTMAEDLVGSMDKHKSPLRQASRLSFVLKSCPIDIDIVGSSFVFAGYHRRHLGQQSCQRLPCCWWCHILRWGGFIHFKTDLQSIFRCVPQSLSQLWSSRESVPLTGTPVGGGTPQLWVSTSSKSHSKQIVLADNFDNWK